MIDPTSKNLKIGVIGAGSWGTALANLLAQKSYDVTLWAREDDVVNQINESHRNPCYLSQYPLCKNLRATHELQEAINEKAVVLLVTPSQHLREILTKISPFLSEDTHIVNASKGIENKTLMTMNEIMTEILPENFHPHFSFLSGPSFAQEVIQQKPAAVTIASKNNTVAETIQKIFYCDYFRTYTTTDVMGVELGGALKNVIAIAVGICEGLALGLNSQAALITRGLGEITKLGIKMGAKPITFLGLAGMGDLILTSTGGLSRNRTVGVKLGQGMKLKDILQEMTMIAEGIKTAQSVHDLAKREEIEMVVCEKVYEILYHDANPSKIVTEMMTRDLKPEFEWFEEMKN